MSFPSPSGRRVGVMSVDAYLLDLDGDLAADVEMRARPSARQHATARLLVADTGACNLAPWFQAAGSGPGLLIVEGLLASETHVAGRTVTALLGTSDLLQPPEANADDLVRELTVWRALLPTRLALLDADFLDRVRWWPQITTALYRRGGRHTADVAMLRAISCQPKLEARLVLLLWHLAARWGRVEPSGFRVCLPLTHRLLGQLVAAERPSISHALTRLAHAGIVTGTAGDWHLHGDLDDHLAVLNERTAPAISNPRRMRSRDQSPA